MQPFLSCCAPAGPRVACESCWLQPLLLVMVQLLVQPFDAVLQLLHGSSFQSAVYASVWPGQPLHGFCPAGVGLEASRLWQVLLALCGMLLWAQGLRAVQADLLAASSTQRLVGGYDGVQAGRGCFGAGLSPQGDVPGCPCGDACTMPGYSVRACLMSAHCICPC